MTYEEIRKVEEINIYIRQADESLQALGYTEHSFAHVTCVAERAGYILETLGFPARTVELAKIAGFQNPRSHAFSARGNRADRLCNRQP